MVQDPASSFQQSYLERLRKPLQCSFSNVNSLKKTLLHIFICFFVQIEAENYKFIYNSRFANFSSGVKFALNLVYFISKFELQLQEATKVSSSFLFQLVRINSSKKRCLQFLIAFLLLEILSNITFLFPLKLVLKAESSWWNIAQTFFEKL